MTADDFSALAQKAQELRRDFSVLVQEGQELRREFERQTRGIRIGPFGPQSEKDYALDNPVPRITLKPVTQRRPEAKPENQPTPVGCIAMRAKDHIPS